MFIVCSTLCHIMYNLYLGYCFKVIRDLILPLEEQEQELSQTLVTLWPLLQAKN